MALGNMAMITMTDEGAMCTSGRTHFDFSPTVDFRTVANGEELILNLEINKKESEKTGSS